MLHASKNLVFCLLVSLIGFCLMYFECSVKLGFFTNYEHLVFWACSDLSVDLLQLWFHYGAVRVRQWKSTPVRFTWTPFYNNSIPYTIAVFWPSFVCLWGSTIRPQVPTPIGRSLCHHSTFFKVQIKLQLSHCPKSIVFHRWFSHVGELDVRSLLGLTWDRLRNQAASGITICAPQITALVIAITSCSRWFTKSWLHKLIYWIDKWIMENIHTIQNMGSLILVMLQKFGDHQLRLVVYPIIYTGNIHPR